MILSLLVKHSYLESTLYFTESASFVNINPDHGVPLGDGCSPSPFDPV